MSTKTSIKRIALVAAAALTLGGFSAVSAHATVNTALFGYTSTATTVGGTALTSAPSGTSYTKNTAIAATALSAFTVKAGATVGFVLTSGSGSFSATTTVGVALNGVTVAQVACTVSTVTCTAANWTAPTTAGTYTMTLTPSGASNSFAAADVTWSSTVSLTVTAASAFSPSASIVRIAPTSATGDAQLSTDSAGYTPTADAVTYSAAKGSTTPWNQVATIEVTMLNADGTAAVQGNAITATMSGSGLVLCDNSSTAANGNARSSTRTATATSENIVWCHVNTDGTSGAGTITISATDAVTGVTTTLGSKSIVSYGSAAKIALVTTNYTVGRAGYPTGVASTTRDVTHEVGGLGAAATITPTSGTSTTPAFVVGVTDSAGNPVNISANGTSVPTISSSDSTVVSGGLCAKDAGSATYGASTNGVGFYNCSFSTSANAVSGKSATLTIKTLDPADTTYTTYLTTTIKVTVGGKVATEAITTDATSYAPGAALVVTLTGKDSAGNAPYDGAPSAASSVAVSKALGGSALSTEFSGYYVGGVDASAASVAKSTTYAPALAGDFIITGTTAASSLAPISATATVTDDAASGASGLALDAANAATDAANNAYDEAQNATQAASDALAAVTALSAQVGALIATVKSLAAVVAKIKAKVKA